MRVTPDRIRDVRIGRGLGQTKVSFDDPAERWRRALVARWFAATIDDRPGRGSAGGPVATKSTA